jgi:hypothetical protein
MSRRQKSCFKNDHVKFTNTYLTHFQGIGYIFEFINMGYRFGKGIHVANFNAQMGVKYFIVLAILFAIVVFFFYLYLFVPYYSYKLLKFEVHEKNSPSTVVYPQTRQVVLEMPHSYPVASEPPPAYVEKY